MKLLSKFRSKSKANLTNVGFTEASQIPSHPQPSSFQASSFGRRPRRDLTTNLPEVLLGRIFAFVCPHATDESYQTCELASPEEGCCLCDARNLAHCARVNKKWRDIAVQLLYHSIRIDVVHYCPREALLSEKRKNHSFFDRNGNPENVGEARLRLLCRTVRSDNPGLGKLVCFFKIPYMLRRTKMTDLARAVAGMPNLQYVDLPDEFFTDHPSCRILRQELEARCPEIRKMNFHHGSEKALEMLATQNLWQNLESLDLEKLVIDPIVIRQALAALPNLRALKITGSRNIDNSLFTEDPRIPPFPALEEVIIEEIPGITSAGIISYLANPTVRSTLNTLSFCETGVLPSELHQILSLSPYLTKLSIIETVHNAFGAVPLANANNSHFPANSIIAAMSESIPLLSSSSLEVFNYEILADNSDGRHYEPVTASYYRYLTSSLLAGGLPTLQTLYVRDINFPDTLTTVDLPILPFADSSTPNKRFSSNNPFTPSNLHQINSNGSGSRPFNKALEVFTKAPASSTWDFNRIEDSLPPAPSNRRMSMHSVNNHSVSNRPLSSYGLTSTENNGTWAGSLVSPSWNGLGVDTGGGVRRSVMITNGNGGYLSLPKEDEIARPSSAGPGVGARKDFGCEWPRSGEEEKRSSRYDMWR